MKRFDNALDELRREHPIGGLPATVDRFRPAARKGGRGWWFAAAAATAAVMGIMLFLPSRSEAARLREIGEALRKARIRHVVNYQVGGPEDGKQSTEAWGEGHFSRLQISRGVWRMWWVSDGHRRWVFQPQKKRVFITEDGAADLRGDTVPELAEAIRRQLPESKVELTEETRDGRPVLVLTHHSVFTTTDADHVSHRYPIKTVYIANADDKLPRETLSYQAVHSDDGHGIRMRLISRGKIDYPKRLPKGIFDTSIPKGWKVASLPKARR